MPTSVHKGQFLAFALLLLHWAAYRTLYKCSSGRRSKDEKPRFFACVLLLGKH